MAEAEVLASSLALPLLEETPRSGFSHALVLTPQRLELRSLTTRQGPVFADFWSTEVRRRAAAGRTQPLARACGLHREGAVRLLDATAGLGRDGIVLAALGCSVTLVERNPVISALLEDAFQRARREPGIGEWLATRVTLGRGEAREHLQAQSSGAYEVILLDPMYPEREKAALPKKEMQVLRAIAGEDPDAAALLEPALRLAGRRVVVKRPPSATPLGALAPDLRYKGKSARYDVYFTRRRSPA